MSVTPPAMVLSAALFAIPVIWASSPAPSGADPTQLTEDEARGRIEATGYTAIAELRKDEHGLWRGRASRNGEPREVSLDAQGYLEDARELTALTMFDREAGEQAPGLIQVSH